MRVYLTGYMIMAALCSFVIADPPPLNGDTGPNDSLDQKVRSLEFKIKQQDQRISDMEGQQKTIVENPARLPNDFRVYWKKGIRMDTVDGAFKLKLGGRLMADWGWVDGSGIEDDLEADLEDGAEIRRARMYFSGTVYENFGFKLDLGFAGGDVDIKDVYIQLKDIPWVGSITVGHFKEPFSLEELTSSKYFTFMEPALPNALVPKRAMGIMAANQVLDDRMTWAAGLYRDVNDFAIGNADGGNAYNLTGRITGLPIYEDKGRKLVHFGAAYSLRHPEDPVRYSQRPEAHFVNPPFTDTGNFEANWINLFGAEAALVCGPISVQAEYIAASTDAPTVNSPCLSGWYIFGSFFLTGENRPYDTKQGSFKRVSPNENFNLAAGTWGAWEVVARYSNLNFDKADLPASATEMNDVTVGLNWYLNPNVRLMANYIRSCVDGNDISNAADIFMMRAQIDF